MSKQMSRILFATVLFFLFTNTALADKRPEPRNGAKRPEKVEQVKKTCELDTGPATAETAEITSGRWVISADGGERFVAQVLADQEEPFTVNGIKSTKVEGFGQTVIINYNQRGMVLTIKGLTSPGELQVFEMCAKINILISQG
jgi:hypothetical protein